MRTGTCPDAGTPQQPDAGTPPPPALDPNGRVCTSASTCSSNSCVDGVCCEERCGACATCNDRNSPGICTAMRGYTDPGECEGTKGCSSMGTCLNVDQKMTTFRADRAVTAIRDPLWQVITFNTAGKLMELRMNLNCVDKSLVINVWFESVRSDGAPSGSRIRTARVVNQVQPPGAAESMHAVVPQTPIDVRAGDRVAVGVQGPPDEQCYVALNHDVTYSGGEMWQEGATELAILEGAMIFEALVAR